MIQLFKIIFSAIYEHTDPVYMVLILSLGFFICNNTMLQFLPSGAKLPIKRISKEYRVLFLTLPLGILLYYLNGHGDGPSYPANKYIEDLLLTWLFTNAFYSYLIKHIIGFFSNYPAKSLVDYFSRKS